MGFDFTDLNDSCLRTFGQEFLFTRVVSLPGDDPATFTGILLAGAEMEQYGPLDGSVSAVIKTKEDILDPPLEAGDEIVGPKHIYKVLRPRNEGGGFIVLLLRQDRPAAP